MGVRVKTNVQGLIAQRQLSQNRRAQANSLERLSSGQRINRSSDDAAGLGVSERIRSSVRSLKVARRNANDGISYIQVAEGALNEVTNIVVRMRELGSQAASDTIGNRERGFLNKEFQELSKEMKRIQDSAEFNGSKLLKQEEAKPLVIFVGASNRGSIDGSPPDIDPESDEGDPDTITINLEAVQDLQTAMDNIFNSGLAVVPDDPEGGAYDLGEGGTAELFNILDDGLNAIAEYRATLGSVQARLNSAISNNEITTENLEAAKSRIRDVDYAAESTKFAQANILTSAGTAVLTQANQRPEAVLQLLRG